MVFFQTWRKVIVLVVGIVGVTQTSIRAKFKLQEFVPELALKIRKRTEKSY